MQKTEINLERRRQVVSNLERIDDTHHMFSVVTADAPNLLEKAYRLRYQVYCIENSLGNPQDHPDGIETDEYDSHAVHCVLIERPSDTVMGTVRIILPYQDALEDSFPMQRFCDHRLLQRNNLLSNPKAAEISRFAISKELRRRAVDRYASQQKMALPGSEQASFPHITLSLLRGLLRMSAEHGVEEWLAIMEITLLRLLQRMGIHFSTVGPMIEYCGPCQPCHANIQKLLARLWQERPDIWRYTTDNGTLFQKNHIQMQLAH